MIMNNARCPCWVLECGSGEKLHWLTDWLSYLHSLVLIRNFAWKKGSLEITELNRYCTLPVPEGGQELKLPVLVYHSVSLRGGELPLTFTHFTTAIIHSDLSNNKLLLSHCLCIPALCVSSSASAWMVVTKSRISSSFSSQTSSPDNKNGLSN